MSPFWKFIGGFALLAVVACLFAEAVFTIIMLG